MKFSMFGKAVVLGTLVLGGVFTDLPVTWASETTMNLGVTPHVVTIGAPASITFPVTQVSSSSHDVEYAASGDEYFFVSDLKGADPGYYTHVQLDHFISSSGGVIPTANVKIIVPNPGTVSTAIEGTNNPRVYVPTGAGKVGTEYRPLNLAVDMISRDEATNYGTVGKYGVLPKLQVTVPAYQSVGLYSGTITFTLIER